jgi:hypothetical protein
MNSGFTKMLFTIVMAAALVLSLGWGAAADSSHHRDEIVGTWQVTVQLNNCSGSTVGGPFHSLLTFADGETMIEDTTNPAFALGQRGTGHGVWEYQGHHAYAVKSIAFISSSASSPLPPGFFPGTQTITQSIDFNNGPDTWTAKATIAFADMSNSVYRHGCATATATRFE